MDQHHRCTIIKFTVICTLNRDSLIKDGANKEQSVNVDIKKLDPFLHDTGSISFYLI